MRIKALSGWVGFLAVVAFAVLLRGQQAASCSNCAIWNTPQEPFRIYGNTWYVGPHGLSSILITSPAGHVLIDGALPQSAPLIAANIKSLGFRIQDVKIILSTHVHFDHAGGIAELQRLSGARVMASKWSADVMKGGAGRGDPQFGSIPPIAPVSRVEILRDGQIVRVGELALTAHFTPGHTPGGTSWTWKSCDAGRCVNVVYADSVTPVSANGFEFSSSRDYPRAAQDFEKSFAFLESTSCDVLLTAHPEVAGLWDHLESRRLGKSPDPLIDAGACRELAGKAQEQFRKRIEAEK